MNINFKTNSICNTTEDFEKDKLNHLTKNGAFIINNRYFYAAFRTDYGSWYYTLAENDMTLIASGQIDDENTSFTSVMDSVLEDNNFSDCYCEEIPWTAALMILELYYGEDWYEILESCVI